MKKIPYKRLTTSAAVLFGIGLSSQAQAGAIAYSYLELENTVLINDTTETQLDVSDFSFLGIADSSSASSVTSFGGPAASGDNTANTALACSGNCGGIVENDETQQVGSTNFGRGDTFGTGNIISGLPGGDSTNVWVVSEGRQSDTGETTAQSGARNSTEFTFALASDTAVRLDFDTISEIYVELHQDDPNGPVLEPNQVAFGSYNWNISVVEIGIGEVFRWSPDGTLNDPTCAGTVTNCDTLSDDFSMNDSHSTQQQEVDGTGGIQNGFFSAVATFEGQTDYRLSIGHASQINTEATKVVQMPEPATLFLLGAGLAGFGMSRRLSKAKA